MQFVWDWHLKFGEFGKCVHSLQNISSHTLNLWGSKDPFVGVTDQMSYISDIYSMTHNSSKLQL